MSLRDYLENKEHYQELFEIERKKDQTIRLLKGLRCETCGYFVLKNEDHYCGGYVTEPLPTEKDNCVGYYRRPTLDA